MKCNGTIYKINGKTYCVGEKKSKKNKSNKLKKHQKIKKNKSDKIKQFLK
jgi:hypothetical protein